MEKHTKVVNIHFPLTPRELAVGISDLRYDALQEFLFELSQKMTLDALNDAKHGRTKLADALNKAASTVQDAATDLHNVWDICEPYETKND